LKVDVRGWARLFAGRSKLRNVRAGKQVDSDFRFMSAFQIVLGEPLPNLTGRAANRMVRGHVAIGLLPENVYANVAFLEFAAAALQCSFDQVRQEAGIAPRISESGASQNQRQFAANRFVRDAFHDNPTDCPILPPVDVPHSGAFVGSHGLHLWSGSISRGALPRGL
jgi:hypothetical protein